MSIFFKIFGDPNERTIKKILPIVEKTNNLERQYQDLSSEQLKQESISLKQRAQEAKNLEDLLPEAFALVREAAKRTIGQRHFDVQLIGGVVLHRGTIAEMRTGEGKTLAATLPAYLNALSGKGVHIVTVNDYLARRDAVWMGQIYHALGFSVSCIQHDEAFIFDPNYQAPKENSVNESNQEKKDLSIENSINVFMIREDRLRPVNRREAYLADITYGTNNEFGFDYLRDNMVYNHKERVQRSLHYAIIDEIDSILIDEARTPLIISAPSEDSADTYYQLARLVKKLNDQDYNIDEKMRSVALLELGQEKLIEWLGIDPWSASNFSLVHHVDAALRAEALFKEDRDYIIERGEVVIIDEFTGRKMHGRRYSEGLHQAIEAKAHTEGHSEVEVQQESRTLATITFQNYFRLYQKLSGMTGTAATEAEEFYKIYNLEVITIPTNNKMIRQDLSDKIFKTEKAKMEAVVKELKTRQEKGQPVLVGTISIQKNEALSALLNHYGVKHEILNAKNHEREAEIIAQAGRRGSVTLATNMAGRGVDIILGGNPPDAKEQKLVCELGGLLVIGTERHESRRIDNQLRGRSGRQGDPGMSQFFISTEDDLMRIFGGDRMKAMMERFSLPEDMPLENPLISKTVEAAQNKVEGYNFDLRKHLLEYDDVLNKQREAIYNRRRQILITNHGSSKEIILKLTQEEFSRIVAFHTVGDAQENWNLKEIAEVAISIFGKDLNLANELEDLREQAGDRVADVYARDRLIKYLTEKAKLNYEKIEKYLIDYGKENLKVDGEVFLAGIERSVMLRSIDNYWIDYLETIENLKAGIGLRAYGQHDPLVEYKREAFQKYNHLLQEIDREIVYGIFKIGLTGNILQAEEKPKEIILSGPSKEMSKDGSFIQAGSNISAVEKNKQKVGRNDPCPCGSGKKYKRCHGA